MILPAKVAASPKATRTVSCISPRGSIWMPTWSRIIPPRTTIAAMINWAIFWGLSFIRVFQIRCKSSIKKRSHQKSGLAR